MPSTFTTIIIHPTEALGRPLLECPISYVQEGRLSQIITRGILVHHTGKEKYGTDQLLLTPPASGITG